MPMGDVGWDSGADAPLYISVTGHRDIPEDCIEGVASRLSELIGTLRKRYGHTRLVMLSAMSEGSDIITAELASEMGLWIAPVFPMPLEEYGRTFDDPAHMERILSLLDGDRTYSPHVLGTDPDAEEADAFINLSSFLIYNSHILVSIWDGRRYPRNGGTYDTTRMAYSGIDAEARKRYFNTVLGQAEKDLDRTFRHLEPVEDCLIYWIPTERESRPDRSPEGRHPGGGGYFVPAMLHSDGELVTELMDAVPSDAFPPFFDDMFSKMDRLNMDLGADVADNVIIPRRGSLIDRDPSEDADWGTRFHLLSDPEGVVGRQVDAIKEYGILDEMARRYAVADRLSAMHQNGDNGNISRLVVFTVLIDLFFAVFILTGGSMMVNIVYSLFMVLSIAVSRVHRRSGEHARFIEYRVLAECTRVEYYRMLLGICDATPSSSYGFMKADMLWVKNVLKSWRSPFMCDYSNIPRIGGTSDSVDLCRACWVSDQEAYHAGKLEANRRRYRVLDRATGSMEYLLTAVSVVLIGMLALFPEGCERILGELEPLYLMGVRLSPGIDVTVEMLIRMSMIVLVAVASYYSMASLLVRGGRPREIDAKRQMFHIARLRMEGSSPETSRRILWELGDQCIDETNDWAFEHIGRDFKKEFSIRAADLD